MGFFDISPGMTVLRYLQDLALILYYIGMVANLLIIMLVIISILLIHSLLMISIEKKTFEFGVMRLTGLSSFGLIALITIQALMFVLPALLFGFIASVPGLYYGYHAMGNDLDLKPLPSGKACLLALTIGTLVPAVSAIVPI